MSLPPEKASELKQIIQDHLIKVCYITDLLGRMHTNDYYTNVAQYC